VCGYKWRAEEDVGVMKLWYILTTAVVTGICTWVKRTQDLSALFFNFYESIIIEN
jgi:hypothetical protein